MSYTIVIPARYASSRLPGKPLLELAGKSMLQRVWERASVSRAERVLVATDDERIHDAATGFGAEVLLTRDDHASGTDRLSEVIEILDLTNEEIVVNVQGDEPLIPPDVIDQVADNLAAEPEASIATLCEAIEDPGQLRNPNVVKVVTDARGMALYFSRACIPWPRAYDWSSASMPEGEWYRHIGLYAYRAGFLRRYTAWEAAPPETSESLEQLRALYAGEKIHVATACATVPAGVDTLADLEALRARLARHA